MVDTPCIWAIDSRVVDIILLLPFLYVTIISTFRMSGCADLERRLWDSTAFAEVGSVLNVTLFIKQWFEVCLLM